MFLEVSIIQVMAKLATKGAVGLFCFAALCILLLKNGDEWSPSTVNERVSRSISTRGWLFFSGLIQIHK